MMDATMFRAWVVEAARLVVDNADHLTHLDAAIGDADHGINLSRGFQAALVMLAETAPTTPGAVLATVGRALISKTGGPSGSLYGAGFPAAAKTLGAAPNGWAGTGVASGTVVAGSWRVDRPVRVAARPIPAAEVERAFQSVAADLAQVAARVGAQGRTAAAEIMGVGALIAADPDLVDAACRAGGARGPPPGGREADERYAGPLGSRSGERPSGLPS